jgi:pimeloyl-ACP methyl ester carboxylesterase
MGEDLVGVADQLGWETFHLIGHSMGGQAVQGILANEQYRERVLSAVLVSPVPSQGFPLDAESESMFLKAASTPAVMEGVVGTLAGGQHSAGFSQYVNALSQATVDEDTLRKYLQAWTLDDVSEGIRGYEGPVLVLSGELDPVLGPPVAGKIAAQFSDSTHHVIPATGHFPPLESPTLVSARIGEHVLAQRAKL